jgi:hypothetical protein
MSELAIEMTQSKCARGRGAKSPVASNNGTDEGTRGGVGQLT